MMCFEVYLLISNNFVWALVGHNGHILIITVPYIGLLTSS